MKVFNLEFEPHCLEINIFGYRFKRVENYAEQVRKLQHLGGSFSEFQIDANTGQHAVTADLILPELNTDAVLKWADKSSSLNDILLLLSIFTGRDVFALDNEKLKEENLVLTADPRVYSWGGILRCSMPYRGEPVEGLWPHECNVGFEEGINQVYDLIKSPEWQKKYHRGDFLFISRTAFRRQPVNSTFILCWAIWEHLFAVINRRWLSEKRIQSLSSLDKISFILVEFGLIDNVDEVVKRQIGQLCSIRNRLIHYGAFPEPTNYFKNSPKHAAKIQTSDTVLSDAVLFIRLTEHILAKILGLTPSDVFNTEDKFGEFLNRNERV